MEETKNTTPQARKTKNGTKIKKKFFERRFAWYLLAVVLVLIILAIGTITGVARGIKDRVSKAESQAAPKIQSQLDGARLDIEEGRYEIALSRLDRILDEMTDYLTEEELAEIGELYSHTLLLTTTKKTPTPQPTPTIAVPEITPTPDLRGVQELYDTARQLVANGEWEEALNTLQALRENDLTFHTVQVDGLLFVALRNRGIQKILAEGSLEPGLYDLSMAERFATLDSRAEGVRTWTRLYLTGASYWDVDWYQVVLYFEQVYPHLPNLHDGSYMTTTERFRIGAIEYAKELFEAGEYCLAQEYFEKSLAISDDPSVRTMSDDATDACLKGLAPPEEPEPGEPTSTTPENEIPQPTAVPTPVPTEAPDDEITPTPTEEPTEESGY